MMRRIAIIGALMSASLLAPISSAQYAEEIIVTASRRVEEPPGVTLKKQGDFFLLEITLENDRRLASERIPEIMATMEKIVSAAARDSEISLSLIDDNNRVAPLTKGQFEDGIRNGPRPDTSIATLQIKTAIPKNVEDGYALATKLTNFAEGLEGEGRTSIDADYEAKLSIVNPAQYRKELVLKIASEIRVTTNTLGPDYRVILDGMDGQMSWRRDGYLNLEFYLPYNYIIVPTSISTFRVNPDEDY